MSFRAFLYLLRQTFVSLERDDGANLFVLEGVLIALIMLGAAYAVQSLQDPASPDVRPRAELERLTHDILIVLEGLDDGNGTSLLDRYLAEQFHCALDATPSTIDCDGARSKNLSIKVEHYLPLGGGYAVSVSNGFGSRELYRSPLPQSESVSSSVAFGPEWNLTFVATELSCYDAATQLNATLVPIARSAVPYARWGNVTVSGAESEGVAAHTARWWNVTVPATRPATGTLVANVTSNDTSLPGAASYGSCDLLGLGATLRAALALTPFTAAPSTIPIGTSTIFSTELGEIAAIPGVAITAANVTVYEPLPPRGTTAETYIETARIALSGSSSRSGSWTVPADTLYGAHPALLRVGIEIGSTQVELRRVAVIQIGLPSGEVPIDPPYRVSLQTWLADWG